MRDILEIGVSLCYSDAPKMAHLGTDFLVVLLLLPHCPKFIESELG